MRIETETLYRLTERKETAQLATIIKSDRVNQLRAAFTKVETEHTRLTATLPSTHPRLSELSTAKNTARQRLEQEFASIVSKLEAEYIAALNTETILQEEVEQQQKKALEAGEFGTVDAVLAAEVTAVRALSQKIGNQQQEGSIVKLMSVPNIAITAQAELPLSPSSPQPLRDLLFALLGGVITAVGLALFIEQTDLSVRTAEDAWQATSYPFLGVIPPQASRLQTLLQRNNHFHRTPSDYSGSRATTNSSLPTTQTTNDLLAESYQSLSAALSLGKRKSPRTILLTSPLSGEGKTTTALNLAITLAWSGYKVALVDADLRTGRCHTLLHRERSPGLSEVLLKGAVLSSSRRRPKKKNIKGELR